MWQPTANGSGKKMAAKLDQAYQEELRTISAGQWSAGKKEVPKGLIKDMG